MRVSPRVREHIALMSRGTITLSGVGGLAGLYGVYELIHETHHRSGWFWLFLGAAVLFLVQIRVVQDALGERDEARAAGSSSRDLREWLDERAQEIQGLKEQFQEQLREPSASYDRLDMTLKMFWDVNDDVLRRLHREASEWVGYYGETPNWYAAIVRTSPEQLEEVVRLMDHTIGQLAHIRAHLDSKSSKPHKL